MFLEVMMLIFSFVLGAIIGSYANVYILRLNTGKDTQGRSACMSCGTKLLWYDLIPILSYLFLKGRCRKCKSKISFQYPIVEFLNATGYLLLFTVSSNILEFSLLAALFSVTLIISVYDIKHKMIPGPTLKYLYALSLALFFYQLFYTHNLSNLNYYLQHIVSILIFAGPIFFLWLFSKGRAMGFGDVKISTPLSLLLYPIYAFYAFVLAFVLGAFVGVLLIFFSKFTKLNFYFKSQIAFGPFIIIAFWLVFFAQKMNIIFLI